METVEQPTDCEIPAAGPGRVRRFLLHVPRAAIAVFIIAILTGADLLLRQWPFYNDHDLRIWISVAMTVGVFLAGAIQRTNRRHALIMVLWCVAAAGWGFISGYIAILNREGYFPYLWIVYAGVVLWLLFMGEAFVTGWRSLSMALWLPLAAFAVSAVHRVIICLAYWSGVRVEQLSLGNLLYYPVLGLLAWSVLPLVLGVRNRLWRYRISVSAMLGVGVALSALFFWVLIVPLARSSVRGHGPFSRHMGVLLLEDPGGLKDTATILDALRDADWTVWFIDPDDPSQTDWRITAIAVLSRHEESAEVAAEAIVCMLRERRQMNLAAFSADLLADQKKVQAVPVLLRYALQQDHFGTMGPSKCAEAMEKLGVREAALYILLECAAYDRPRTKPADFPISASNRQRLSTILGQDFGAMYLSWARGYDDPNLARPSSLPPAFQEEVDREVSCYSRFAQASNRWLEARAELSRRRLAAEGRSGALASLQAFQKQVGNRFMPDALVPDEVRSEGDEVMRVLNTATSDMKVTKPDYDVSTVEQFETEVDRYEDEVDAVIRRFLSRTTSATTPTRNVSSQAHSQGVAPATRPQ